MEKTMSSSKHPQEVIDFAKKCFEFLKENYLGEEICTEELVYERMPEPPKSFGPGENGWVEDTPWYPFQSDDLWAVHDALFDVASRSRKYVLDSDSGTFCAIGLPPVCPYVLRCRKDKHKNWIGMEPYFRTGKEYLEWIREEWLYNELPKPYQIYFKDIRDAVAPCTYETPVSEEEMEVALERSQRTGELIDIVPDQEYLPGGTREGQLDGWSYHIEFLSPDEYFKRHPDSEEDE